MGYESRTNEDRATLIDYSTRLYRYICTEHRLFFELALEVSIKTIREHPFVSKLIYIFMYDYVIQTKNCSENAKAKFEL